MNPDKKRNYTKLNKVALKMGLTITPVAGFYGAGTFVIDLTASGLEEWQVALNISRQLIPLLTK